MTESVFVDHYSLLGLDLNAGPADVKRRFRELAKIHHPDRSGGDGLKFLEVYSAYRVLGDPAARKTYDRQYLRYMGRTGQSVPNRIGCIVIPVKRLIFPGNVALLAKKGLLRKKFRSRDRKRILKIDYDVELPLWDGEFDALLKITIPLVVRATCPECLGSNPHCGDCGGRGSYKTSRNIAFYLEGGLTPGQVLEIDLKRIRLDRLTHFKKRKLRIKISRKNKLYAAL